MKNNIPKIYTIEEIQQLITPILQEYEVEKAYIFGSYARGEATEDSDVDIMIKKGKLETLLQFSGLALKIETVLHKELDLVTEETYTEQIKYDNEYGRKAKEIFYNQVKKDRRLIYS